MDGTAGLPIPLTVRYRRASEPVEQNAGLLSDWGEHVPALVLDKYEGLEAGGVFSRYYALPTQLR